MLEKYVATVLVNWLGRYVENLSSENLHLSLWAGVGTLGDVWLRKDALDELDFPVKVGRGLLRSLKFQIPWTALYSQPCICTIEELVIVAEPRSREEWNQADEQRREWMLKEHCLAMFEKARKTKEVHTGAGAEVKGFINQLTEVITNNIQVTINKVQLRIETDNFAFGAVLDHVSLHTTNESGEKTFVTPEASLKDIHKVVELNAFRIYTDLPREIPHPIDPAAWADRMWQQIKDAKDVLGPVDATAALQLTRVSGTMDLSVPYTLLSLQVPDIEMRLSHQQYTHFVHFAAWCIGWESVSRYRQFRPAKGRPIAGDGSVPKWWRFAIQCILLVLRYQKTLARQELTPFQQALYDEYRIKYERHVRTSAQVTRTLKFLENALPLSLLTKARNEVYNRLQKDLQLLATQPKVVEPPKKQTWGEWLMGTQPKTEAQYEPTLEDVAKAWGINPNEKCPTSDVVIPKNFVWFSASLMLGRLGLTLETEVGDCTLSIQGTTVAYQSFNAPSSMRIEVGIGDIVCTNPYANAANKSAYVLHRSPNAPEDMLLMCTLDVHPPDVEADIIGDIRVLPLRLSLDPSVVNLLSHFVSTERNVFIKSLATNATTRMNELTAAAFDSVTFAVENALTMNINVELSAPEIVLSESLVRGDACSSLMVSLGNLSLRSVPVTTEEKKRRKEIVSLNVHHPSSPFEPKNPSEDDTSLYYEYQVALSKVHAEVTIPAHGRVQLLFPLMIKGSLYTLLDPSDVRLYAKQFRAEVSPIHLDASLPTLFSITNILGAFSAPTVQNTNMPPSKASPHMLESHFELSHRGDKRIAQEVEVAKAASPMSNRKRMFLLVRFPLLILGVSDDIGESASHYRFIASDTEVILRNDTTIVETIIRMNIGEIRSGEDQAILTLRPVTVTTRVTEAFFLSFEVNKASGTIGKDVMGFSETVWDFLQLLTTTASPEGAVTQAPIDPSNVTVNSTIAVCISEVEITGMNILPGQTCETPYVTFGLKSLDLCTLGRANGTMEFTGKVGIVQIEDKRAIIRCKSYDKIITAERLSLTFSNLPNKCVVPQLVQHDTVLRHTNTLRISIPKSEIVYDQVTILEVLGYATTGYLSRFSVISTRPRYDGKEMPAAQMGPRVLTRIDIQLDHPHVFLAPSLDSTAYFVGDMGRICISNTIVYHDELWQDKMTISFTDLSVRSQTVVIPQTSLTLDILAPIACNTPQSSLFIRSDDSLHFYCDADNYLLLLRLVGDNFLRQSSQLLPESSAILTKTMVEMSPPARAHIGVAIKKLHFGIKSYALVLSDFRLDNVNEGTTQRLSVGVQKVNITDTVSVDLLSASRLEVGLEVVGGNTNIDIRLSVERMALAPGWLSMNDEMYNADTVQASRGIFGVRNPNQSEGPPAAVESGGTTTLCVHLPATTLDFVHSHDGAVFAQATFSSLACSMEMSGSTLNLKGELGNVLVKATNDVILVDYPASTSKSLLSFGYTQSPISRSVTVVLQEIRVFYIRRLFDELVFFFIDPTEPVARISLLGNTKEARSSASTGSEGLLQLDLSWKQPTIVLPFSDNVNAGGIEVNLGQLRITNAATVDADTTMIDLSGALIVDFMDPVSMSVEYAKAKPPKNCDHLMLKVGAIQLVISEATVTRVLRMLSGNMSIGWQAPMGVNTLAPPVTPMTSDLPQAVMVMQFDFDKLQLAFFDPKATRIGKLTMSHTSTVIETGLDRTSFTVSMKSLTLMKDVKSPVLKSAAGDRALTIGYESVKGTSKLSCTINSISFFFLSDTIGGIILIFAAAMANHRRLQVEDIPLSPDPSPTSSSTFLGNVILRSFAVTFYNESLQEVCHFYQQASEVEFSFSPEVSMVSCRVGSVHVDDRLSTDTIFPRIVVLGVEGGSDIDTFANVKWQSRKRTKMRRLPEFTTELDIAVRTAKIIFLPTVFFPVIHSVQNTIAYFSSVNAKADPALERTITTNKKLLTMDRLKLTVVLDEPLIVVPLVSSSEEALTISLGQTSIETSLVHETTPFELMCVRTEKVRITALDQDVLKALDKVAVEVKTSLDPQKCSGTNVHIPDIAFSLNDKQYLLTLRILAKISHHSVNTVAPPRTTPSPADELNGTRSASPTYETDTEEKSPQTTIFYCGNITLEFYEGLVPWLVLKTEGVRYEDTITIEHVREQCVTVSNIRCLFGDKNELLQRTDGHKGNILDFLSRNLSGEVVDISVDVTGVVVLVDALLVVKILQNVYYPFQAEYQGFKKTFTPAMLLKDLHTSLESDLTVHPDAGIHVLGVDSLFHTLDLKGHTLRCLRRVFDSGRATIVLDNYTILRVTNGNVEVEPHTTLESYVHLGEGAIIDVDVFSVKYVLPQEPLPPPQMTSLTRSNTRIRTSMALRMLDGDPSVRSFECELRAEIVMTKKFLGERTHSINDLHFFYIRDSDCLLQNTELHINMDDETITVNCTPLDIRVQGYHVGLVQRKIARITEAMTTHYKDVFLVTPQRVTTLDCTNKHPVVFGGLKEGSVSLPSLLLLLSDDVSGLIRVHLSGVAAKMKSGREALTEISGNIAKLEVDYFSRTHLCWEPMVEPSHLHWASKTTPEDNKISLDFPEGLDVIVTPGLVGTLNALAALRMNADKPCRKVLVVNRTTDLLRVRSSDGGAVSTITSGERTMLSVYGDSIEVEDSSTQSISVNFFSVGTHTNKHYFVKVMGKDGEVHIGVSHFVVYEKRCFTIRFMNYCRIPLEIAGVGCISANHEEWVSLNNTTDLRAALRITVLHDYFTWDVSEASRSFLLLSDLIGKGTARMKFKGRQHAGSLYVDVKWLPREKLNSVECIEVYFTSAIMIKNELCLPIRIELYNPQGSPLTSVIPSELPPGWSLPAITANPNHEPLAKVTFEQAGEIFTSQVVSFTDPFEMTSRKSGDVTLFTEVTNVRTTLYVPFVILNHTQTKLGFLTRGRTNNSIEFNVPPGLGHPYIPFAVSTTEFNCRLRVLGGDWSDEMPLHTITAVTTPIPLKGPSNEFVHITCYSEMATAGQYRVLHFSPRWVFINRCPNPIFIARDDTRRIASTTGIKLPPNIPIHFYMAAGVNPQIDIPQPTKVCIAKNLTMMEPNTGLHIDNLGEVSVRIYDDQRTPTDVTMSVVPSHGINFVQIEERSMAPYLLVNCTPFPCEVSQFGVPQVSYQARPYAMCPFALQSPYGDQKVVLRLIERTMTVPVSSTLVFTPLTEFRGCVLYYGIAYNAQGQVVLTLYSGIEGWLSRTKLAIENSRREEASRLTISALSVSFVGEVCEVAVLQCAGLIMKMQKDTTKEHFMFYVERFQIDNETETTPPFEVVIAPQTKDLGAPVYLSWERPLDSNTGRNIRFEAFSVNIVPMTVQVGDVFLSQVLAFVKQLETASSAVIIPVEGSLDSEALTRIAPKPSTALSTVLEFDSFTIKSIETRIWFHRQRGEHDVLKETSFGKFVDSIEDYAFTIEEITLRSSRDRAQYFLAGLKEIYVRKATENMNRILFNFVKTMPLVGTPLQAFSALTSGVKSTITDPEAAPKHVVQMAGNISSGVLGGVSALTGALASGLNQLSDKESGRRVETTNKRWIPFQHVLKGVVHGVSDVISKPSIGNVVGIVTKPVGGIIQDVSSATGLVANALSSNKVTTFKRYRMPRVFGETGAVLPVNNLVLCIQNQRRFPIGWTIDLLPGDPPAWTDSRGTACSKEELVRQAETSGYTLTEWKLEEGKGAESWVYAEDFDREFHNRELPSHVVRRRFWYAIRTKKRSSHVDPINEASDPSHLSDRPIVVVEAYENQRDFKLGFGFSNVLLPTDRSAWSNRDGTTETPREKFIPPDGWQWSGDWYLVEEEGWEYAGDFTGSFHKDKASSDYVRRRCWRRKMIKI